MLGINVLTVTQLNTFVKSLLDGNENLNMVFLSGEISNLTNHYQSGHIYFSLRDDKSAVKAVMFSSCARQLRFKPENGMKGILRGRVSLYEATGTYQIYVEDMQISGLGELNLAFEQLKVKLAAEGLFDKNRKKPIPRYPHRIGLITAKTGAAFWDVQSILKRRFPLIEILFYPVLVQGEKAPEQIIKAIDFFNKTKEKVDVLLITRGGGSLEDLWAFNDENLARKISESEIPIVSAVGHETDFTICDFVADLRAPTPSAAAELISPEINETIIKIDTSFLRIQNVLVDKLNSYKRKLDRASLKNHRDFVNMQHMKADLLIKKLEYKFSEIFNYNRSKFIKLSSALENLSPLKILNSGYSIAMLPNKKTVNSINKVKENDKIKLRLSDGTLECVVDKIYKEKLEEK